MKKHHVGVLCAGLLTIGLSATVQAALIDRGNGLIYDDVLDVTWLQDANYAATQYAATSGAQGDADGAMTWDAAQTWAGGLTYQNHSNWRLPKIEPWNGTSYDMDSFFTQDKGYYLNSPVTELGYMFYQNLGYNGMYDGASYNAEHGADENSIFGDSLEFDARYWSGSEFSGSEAMYFSMSTGYQSKNAKTAEYYAWAVHDGDVAPVPIPAAVWLFGSGLMGLLSFGRFRKRS